MILYRCIRPIITEGGASQLINVDDTRYIIHGGGGFFQIYVESDSDHPYTGRYYRGFVRNIDNFVDATHDEFNSALDKLLS